MEAGTASAVVNATILEEFSSFYKTYNSSVGDVYVSGANTTDKEAVITIIGDDIKSVYVGVYGNTAGTVINNVSIYGTKDNYEIGPNTDSAFLSSIPTSNGYFVNQTVYSTETAKKWVWDGIQWNEISTT